ncbi:MAG: TetR/AcrR family transcriptional regulator [Gemmatimonadaceae bacterium]
MTEETLDVRGRIIRATALLLESGGKDAVSTRAVAAAAGVQAPTIYRQFGDMQGLLQVVAADTLSAYVQQKRVLENSDDPIADLRHGWDHHVAFGVGNPATYLLIYNDAELMAGTPAKREGEAILRSQVTRIAEDGRLGVGVEHAARMINAACRGVVLSLISTAVEARDVRLSDAVREAILTAITVPLSSDEVTKELQSVNRVASRAVALRAVLAEKPNTLSPAEELLLRDWLDRLASTSGC